MECGPIVGARRSGSAVVIVTVLLVVVSVMVYALMSETIERQRGARQRFDQAVASWAARGGVHYAVSWLGSFQNQPAQALTQPEPAFCRGHMTDTPAGWFIGSSPWLDPGDTTPKAFGVISEQSRMPLSNLTTGAIAIVLDPSVQQAYRQYVASRRAAAKSGNDPATRKSTIFRHPFELMVLDGFTRAFMVGQDFNDNMLLEPYEASRDAPNPLGNDQIPVKRGLVDITTAFADIFDPYEAPDDVMTAFLSDFPAVQQKVRDCRTAKVRPPPVSLDPSSADWVAFANAVLTSVSTFFRIVCHATIGGRPVARVTCVTEFVVTQQTSGPATSWFRIAQWRRDG